MPVSLKLKNKRPKKGKHTDNTQDNEAAYVSKKDSTGKVKTTYGFKIHLNCDEDSFVKKVETTLPMSMIPNVLPRC